SGGRRWKRTYIEPGHSNQALNNWEETLATRSAGLLTPTWWIGACCALPGPSGHDIYGTSSIVRSPEAEDHAAITCVRYSNTHGGFLVALEIRLRYRAALLASYNIFEKWKGWAARN